MVGLDNPKALFQAKSLHNSTISKPALSERC